MQMFFALRRGSEFKVAHISVDIGTPISQLSLRYYEEGWEFDNRPYDSREEAEQAIVKWKAQLNQS